MRPHWHPTRNARQNPKLAREVNVEATENLARVAQKWVLKFIYISTDAVFDGKRGNYTETDSPAPFLFMAEQSFKANPWH